jgi:hypothetical protein
MAPQLRGFVRALDERLINAVQETAVNVTRFFLPQVGAAWLRLWSVCCVDAPVLVQVGLGGCGCSLSVWCRMHLLSQAQVAQGGLLV